MLSGMVVDNLRFYFVEDTRQVCIVSNIDPIEMGLSINICFFTTTLRPEIIDYSHFMACCDIKINNVRPDKASTPGNKYPHNMLYLSSINSYYSFATEFSLAEYSIYCP